MTGAGVSYDVGSWRLGDDGCIHRRGRMRFSNGDVYDGEWVNGKRHGSGTFRFANGSSYVGDFHANSFHGVGLLTVARTQHPLTKKWISGEKYDGEFQRGKKHGRGVGKNSKGDTYEGDYQNDCYYGRGMCTYANGEMYDGHWVRGKWHGSSGELRRSDGSIYVGDFVNGLFHGYGKLSYGSGARHGYYSGDFLFGQRHGQGVRVFGDGKRYEGDWRDDAMHGVGMLECDELKFVGEFAMGQFHGHGVVSYATGDSYEGSFSRGELDGTGRYEYADGGRYDGQFLASQKHGNGTRVFSTGDVYTGEWREDLMHGRGILERRVALHDDKGLARYRYDGKFQSGHETGDATISYEYTPKNAHDSFEWTDEYEFPLGSGLWHCGRGTSTYVGQVLRGAYHGNGELLSPDGRRWRGQWRDGKLDGEAHCVYLPLIHEHLVDNDTLPLQVKELVSKPSGLYRIVRYDGAFAGGVRHGRGRLLFENGDWLIGEFLHGFATGVVTYRFPSGKERGAAFEKGQRVRWLSDQEEEEITTRAAAESESQAQSACQRQSMLRALVG